MYNIADVVRLTGGKLIGDFQGTISGFSPLNEATQGSISFYGNNKYLKDFEETKASVVLVDAETVVPPSYQGSTIVVDNVYLTVSKILDMLNPGLDWDEGIADSAMIADSATIGKSASVGHLTIVNKRSTIGSGTQVGDQVYIGIDCEIGKNCILYPGVRILDRSKIGDNVIIHANTVVGADGFGFAPDAEGNLKKVAQVGKVIIEDNVEIGANCAIDRGSLKDTIIRQGVKLDNLIQVAHNVEIGSHTVIAAQTGIAGSTTIGDQCMIGGQVGIVGHLNIASKTSIQAQSGMIKSVKEENTQWYGYPAIPYKNYLRSYAQFKNLDDLSKRVRELEQKLDKKK